MAITTNPQGLKALLDAANPNNLADLLRSFGLGSQIRAMPTPLRNRLPLAVTVNPYVIAGAQSLQLPDDAKAHSIFRAFARSGTGTVGPLTVDNPDTFAGSNPAAGHVVVSPSGDILFNAADAWTSVDVMYLPEKHTMYEVTLPVVTNSLTLPTGNGAIILVAEVQAVVGTSVGNKIVDQVGTAPAAGHSALNAARTAVAFNSADAVTSARVKFAAVASTDIDALFEAAAAGIGSSTFA